MSLRRFRARALNYSSNTSARVGRFSRKHGVLVVVICVLFLVATSALLLPYLQSGVQSFFTDARLAILRPLLVALGGALLGATAIGFSVVMLAVQLNFIRVDDMPTEGSPQDDQIDRIRKSISEPWRAQQQRCAGTVWSEDRILERGIA